jgi:hypothetical protein
MLHAATAKNAANAATRANIEPLLSVNAIAAACSDINVPPMAMWLANRYRSRQPCHSASVTGIVRIR